MADVQVRSQTAGGVVAARVATVAFQPNVLQWLLLAILAGSQPWPLHLMLVLGALLLPLAGYLVYLRVQGLALGFDLPRQYRILPFLINNACLVLLSLSIRYWFVPAEADPGGVVLVLLGIAYLLVVNLLAGLLTLGFKVSLHVTAAAGMSILWYVPVGIPLLWRLGAVGLLLVVLAWSRLRLQAHTAGEILAAMALGISLPLLIFSLGLNLPV